MAPLYGSLSATEVVVLVLMWAVILGPGAITVSKGHVALFVAGFFLVGLVWLIAAFRLAKPNSPWARRFYDDRQMARARERYPDMEPSTPSRAWIAATIGFGLIAAAFVVGFVSGLTSG